MQARRVVNIPDKPSIVIPFGCPALSGNERTYLLDAIDHDQFSASKYVKQFECSVQRYIGASYAVAVSSGTAALHLALLAAGVGIGDEVIIPALTFASTAFAVSYTGATPVVVDVDPETWCISLKEIEAALTKYTRAIIPVHLYGARAPVGLFWSKDYWLIEDACEAWGTPDLGLGEMSCFSLQGSKTIQAGEGGVIVTNSKINADKLRHLRGQAMTERRYWHDAIGYNYRMTELQGAVAAAQIEAIDLFVARRQNIMRLYREQLHDLTCQVNDGCWAFAVLVPEPIDRDTVIERMLAAGVETRPVFYDLSDLPPYRGLPHPPHPVAQRIAKQGIVLPVYPDLDDADVAFVCEQLRNICHL